MCELSKNANGGELNTIKSGTPSTLLVHSYTRTPVLVVKKHKSKNPKDM